jgi:hypothetical protein
VQADFLDLLTKQEVEESGQEGAADVAAAVGPIEVSGRGEQAGGVSSLKRPVMNGI